MDLLPCESTALFIIDVQQGFTTLCPQELPVPGGLEIVPAINRLLGLPWARIDASQDWHPPDHCSFVGQRDNLYPAHCVQGTTGAQFVPGLDVRRFQTIWRKGFQPHRDAYAATQQHLGLPVFLRASGIAHVVLCGIATNICCYFTARDLRRSGFRVVIVEDACAALEAPAMGLFQAQAKAEGTRMGIEYDMATNFIGNVRA